jgi:hypothetical protein
MAMQSLTLHCQRFAAPSRALQTEDQESVTGDKASDRCSIYTYVEAPIPKVPSDTESGNEASSIAYDLVE